MSRERQASFRTRWLRRWGVEENTAAPDLLFVPGPAAAAERPQALGSADAFARAARLIAAGMAVSGDVVVQAESAQALFWGPQAPVNNVHNMEHVFQNTLNPNHQTE